MVMKSSCQWNGRSKAACMVSRPGSAAMAKSSGSILRLMFTVFEAQSGQSMAGRGPRYSIPFETGCPSAQTSAMESFSTSSSSTISAKRPGAMLPTQGVSRMWRAGLIVTHWIAISGVRPDWIARRTLWSVAPIFSVSEALRSSVAKATCDQSVRPRSIRPAMISGMECGLISMKMPWRSLSHTSSAVQPSWSEARPAAAKALMELRSRRPAPWPSTTPRFSNVAWIMPQSRLWEGFSGFQTAGQSITSSRPATMRLCFRKRRLLVVAVIAAAPFIGGGRHCRAGQGEDLHRRAVPPGGEPELEIVRRHRRWRIRGSPRRSRCCRAGERGPLRIPA